MLNAILLLVSARINLTSAIIVHRVVMGINKRDKAFFVDEILLFPVFLSYLHVKMIRL